MFDASNKKHRQNDRRKTYSITIRPERIMKLPSVTRVFTDAAETFVRFPLVILNAVIGTVCALILIEFEGTPGPTILFPILFGTIFGLPLLTGLTLLTERWKWGTSVSIAVHSAGVAAIILYALSVPMDLTDAPAFNVLRMLLFSAGALLFGISVPFLKDRNDDAMWNFCSAFVIRIITSGLFAIVLWGGIAIALAALNNLFGLEFPEKRYGELWVFIVGVFSVWFFLAGLPVQDELDKTDEYPKGLRIFSQYIVIPLLFTYFIILYLYIGKILIAWSWPHGWVSRLILGFVATGIAAMLMVHPIKQRPEHSWLQTASRWFMFAIIPLAVMLTLAVGQRVTDYGITEGRYLGFAVVVWMLLLAAYFIFSNRKSILFIPLTLGAAVWMISVGPWGMFAVSEASQVGRLKALLTEQNILVDGTVRSEHGPVNSEAAREINALISYLSEYHGFGAIQPWFRESLLRDTSGNGTAFKEPAKIAPLIGISYSSTRYLATDGSIILSADRNGAMDIRGYHRLLRGQRINAQTSMTEHTGDGITFRAENELNSIVFTIGNGTLPEESLTANVRELCDTLLARNGNGSVENIPSDEMSVEVSGKNGSVKVFFFNIRLERKEKNTQIVSLEAHIAYRRGP